MKIALDPITRLPITAEAYLKIYGRISLGSAKESTRFQVYAITETQPTNFTHVKMS